MMLYGALIFFRFIAGGVQEPGTGSSESDSESSSGESEPTSTYTSSKTWMNYSEILEDGESGDPEISMEFSNMTMISAALRERSILNCPQRVSHFVSKSRRHSETAYLFASELS